MGKGHTRLKPGSKLTIALYGYLGVVDGHNFKTAAAEMGVSVHGISFHTRNIYEKVQVHSKSEAVAKALRLGLVR